MNITMLLDMAADGFGERVVVGTREQGLTARQLQRLSASGAAEIRKAGADALIYLAVNGPAFPVAMFAAARAGVPLVPVNYRLGREQLDALLAHHPRALGIAGADQAEALDRAGMTVYSPQEWLRPITAASETEPDFDHTGEPVPPAVIIYTSGTTSAPKGVLLRHENLSSYVLGSVEFSSADENEAALVSVPPYHIAAVANVITNLYAGRRMVVLEQFTPGQ
ncbi:MAG: long-chain fatty acid--CoA ligase, partial [Comamonadaceae bacterium]